MSPVAALGMYDLPALRAETDQLWAALREALRLRGVAAPEALARGEDPAALWTDPGLVLGQTCGLPYVTRLRGRVRLVGAPDYGQQGCPPGWYRSAVIVGRDHPAERLEDLAGARPAINARTSQSGYAALMHATAPMAEEGRFFAEALTTGGHAASLAAVAEGRADCAAIDCVSWTLMARTDPAAGAVRVLTWSAPTPGLPYITSLDHDPAVVAEAAEAAIATLPDTVRAALSLEGFVRHPESAYDLIAERLAAAEAAHTLPGA